MTNWVETVQNDNYNGPVDLENAERLMEEISLESEEEEYGSEGLSDVGEGMGGTAARRKQ